MPDVPDSEAAAYKELQEQAAQHIMASSNSPQMAQAQMMAGIPAGHIPGEMHHAIPQQFLQVAFSRFLRLCLNLTIRWFSRFQCVSALVLSSAIQSCASCVHWLVESAQL